MNDGLKHKHNYLLDVEAIFTPDGGIEQKSSIFLECVEGDCSHIVRGNAIIEFIEGLEEENAQLRDRLEVYRDELMDIIRVNIRTSNAYAKRIAELTQTIKKVEWIFEPCHDPANPSELDECIWCHWMHADGHAPDCERQIVLGLAKVNDGKD